MRNTVSRQRQTLHTEYSVRLGSTDRPPLGDETATEWLSFLRLGEKMNRENPLSVCSPFSRSFRGVSRERGTRAEKGTKSRASPGGTCRDLRRIFYAETGDRPHPGHCRVQPMQVHAFGRRACRLSGSGPRFAQPRAETAAWRRLGNHR